MGDPINGEVPYGFPTHPNPPIGIAPQLLGKTEGDSIFIYLESDDTVFGPITETELEPPGEFFDTPGQRLIRFQGAGVAFELTMTYTTDDGTPVAQSLDLRLVEHSEWNVPVTVDIENVR